MNLILFFCVLLQNSFENPITVGVNGLLKISSELLSCFYFMPSVWPGLRYRLRNSFTIFTVRRKKSIALGPLLLAFIESIESSGPIATPLLIVTESEL